MGTPVQSLISDPQFQSLSPEGKRTALRGVGGADFASISDNGVDQFITGMAARNLLARQPGAMQLRQGVPGGGPGSPIVNAENFIPPPPETAGHKAAGVLREGTLGLTSGLSGLPETQTPISSAVEGIAAPPSTGDIVGSSLLGPAYGAVKGIAQSLYGAGKEVYQGARGGSAEQVAHGVGSLAGQGLQLEMGREAGPAVGEDIAAKNITKGTEKVGQGLGIPTSKEALAVAGKGAPEELSAARDLDIAKKDLAQIARKSPITAKGSAGAFAHGKAILDYAANLWETEHAPPIARNVNTVIDSQALAQDAKKVLTPEAIASDPANAPVAKRLNNWIDMTVAQPRTLGSADKLLRELNADIEAASASATKPYGQLQMRVKQAVVEGLRKQIEATLTGAGESGVAEVNQRYGALKNLAGRAIDQGLAEARAEGRTSVIPPWVHAYNFVHPTAGGVATSVGAGIHPSGMSIFKPTPSKMLSKGMKRLGSSNLEAPPQSVAPPPSTAIPAPPQYSTPAGPQEQFPYAPAAPIPAPPAQPGFSPVQPPTPGTTGWNDAEAPVKQGAEQRNLWGRPVSTGSTETTPGGMITSAPPSGLVKQEFGKIGLSDLVTPQQSTTLETLMRGPRWKDMDRADRVAAVRDVLSRK
jgi:hypothetical protein